MVQLPVDRRRARRRILLPSCRRACAYTRADVRVLVRLVKRGCARRRPEGRETGGAETTAVGCSCQILRLL